jgi:pimeloyl-ACP methyl ester carboxylesterase
VSIIPGDRPHSNDGAEVTLSLDDGEIYVRQDGPRDAAALLLIHGNASSARWWDELVPMLTRSHRVIRIDLLGYGRSAKPADRSYALPDQARRVGMAIDRLGVEQVIAVGHSSGGAVATALAEQRPNLVTALVLINTGPQMGAYIAPPMAIDPPQWPDVSDEQLRQLASPACSRPGYQIPPELLNEVRAMTFPRTHHNDAGQPRLREGAGASRSAHAPWQAAPGNFRRRRPQMAILIRCGLSRGSRCDSRNAAGSRTYTHTRGSGADRLLRSGLHRDPDRAGKLNQT